jgi:hypothetical protein
MPLMMPFINPTLSYVLPHKLYGLIKSQFGIYVMHLHLAEVIIADTLHMLW